MLKVRSIFEPDARADLLARIDTLQHDTPRRWGRMTVDAMVVHLSEGYRFVLEAPSDGEGEMRGFVRAKAEVMRRIALGLPVPWPRGAPSPAAMRIDGSLRPAAEFDAEVRQLRAWIERFGESGPDRRWPPHPMFGRLTTDEWGRWGWRHADHHLRQFGA